MAVRLFVLILLFSNYFNNGNILSSEALAVPFTNAEKEKDYFVEMLRPNENVESSAKKFSIYCQPTVHKSLIYVWRSVALSFEKTPQNFKLFEGENETEVYQKYRSETVFNPASWVSWRDSVITFPAFSQHCLGVSSTESYTLRLKVRTINYWKVLQMAIGIMLFFSAPSLSRNSFFHYTSGVSFGILTSVLILLFLMAKLIPKKSASYTILAFGYSFVLYLLQQFYYEIPKILSVYMDVVLGYAFVTAFISFIFCYRLGPVKDLRTFRIIQWSMQTVAIILIFFSTEFREVSTAIIMIILLSQVFPTSWTAKLRSMWSKYFPPKVKLLTDTEYIEQGNRETKKALEELRQYCSSPECKAWSTMLKLKSPNRFASFVEGDSHLNDEEILLYDSECVNEEDMQRLLTDDDNDDDYESNLSFSSPNSR